MGRSRLGVWTPPPPPPPPPLKNHKNIGFLAILIQIPVKATKPAFNGGPLSTCQENTISRVQSFQWWAIIDTPAKHHFKGTIISMAFCCGSMIACLKWYLDPTSPHQLKNNKKGQSWTPSDKAFWICACVIPLPGPVAQSIASPIADPGVVTSILARLLTFV